VKPRVRIGESVSAQRGFALIALLALAALISAFLIASALNITSAGNSNEREDRSMKALRQAKAALIAYAASETWQTGGTTPFQPGALPCPDRDNDGIAEDHEFPQKPCDTALKRIGRFPWKTIGAEDLHDASGESLWYAVSAGFLKNTPSYTNVINSDTPGQLTVNGSNGSTSATNVVAIVFAPGEAIQGQVRSPANLNDPASYLEQFNTLTYATFTSTALRSAINNDRLLVITQADLMATVEPIVAANIERDIKPAIQAYSMVWANAFPFAVPLGAGPSATQSAYTGQAGQTLGLLPITNSPTLLSWRPGSVTVLQINGGTGSLTSVPPIQITSSCSMPPAPATQFTCRIDYPGGSDDRPAIQMQAVLEKAALSFPKALTYNDPSMLDQNSDPVTVFDPAFGQWSGSSPAFPVTVDHVPAADGSGLVRFRGRLQNAGSPMGGTGGTVFITVSVPGYMPITNSADPTVGWFITNQWHRQTFFAVSPGFAPGGGGACSLLPAVPPPPSCLKVNNVPSPTNNKRAILVFAGRALNGSPRPSGTLSDYLEGQNSTPADFIYEHRAGTPTTINDRVVVVSP
jgi:type II secretory pathway pseudopilin PulG